MRRVLAIRDVRVFFFGWTVSVFGDWFQLRLVYNQGAAFGLHVGPYSRWIFFTVALAAVFVLTRMSRSSPIGDRFRQLALGLPKVRSRTHTTLA